MKSFGNSGKLTKMSYGVVKRQRRLYRWTVKAGIYGFVAGAIGVIPGAVLIGISGVIADDPDGTASATTATTASGGSWPLAIAGFVIMVAGMVAGSTAANVQLASLVKAADDELHGRTPDDDAARQASRQRLGALVSWSVVSVAMGLLVSLIRGDGNSGVVSSIVRGLLAGLVAAVWAVVTTLVLPVIVLERLGTISAIKRSAGIIRSTWGEALLGGVRIGLRFTLLYVLPGILLIVGGVALAVVAGAPWIALGVIGVIVGLALVAIGAVKAATCRTVFGVALYRWATGDGPLGPFSEDDLRGAVRTKG